MKIAVAGTGYVGLSLAVLLSQHNEVVAVDIVQEKVEKINEWKSPTESEAHGNHRRRDSVFCSRLCNHCGADKL